VTKFGRIFQTNSKEADFSSKKRKSDESLFHNNFEEGMGTTMEVEDLSMALVPFTQKRCNTPGGISEFDGSKMMKIVNAGLPQQPRGPQ
jgi:hypothetical protein